MINALFATLAVAGLDQKGDSSLKKESRSGQLKAALLAALYSLQYARRAKLDD